MWSLDVALVCSAGDLGTSEESIWIGSKASVANDDGETMVKSGKGEAVVAAGEGEVVVTKGDGKCVS